MGVGTGKTPDRAVNNFAPEMCSTTAFRALIAEK
jgi:hypothetical protein